MDTSSLDKLRKHNHDFPLVTLDNPKGQVPAKSKTALKVREDEWQDQDEAQHTIHDESGAGLQTHAMQIEEEEEEEVD